MGSSIRIGTEVGAGSNIADVVVLRREDDCEPAQRDTLTVFESVILASLRRVGSTRIDLLEQRCGIDRRALREGALQRLLAWRLVERGRGGVVRLGEQWPGCGQIIAIEAKLTRWREALDQARRYRSYADRSYVLLPGKGANGARHAEDEFAKSGVGLLIGHADSIEKVFEAKLSQDHDWRREFVYSRLALTGTRNGGGA